MRGMLTEKSGKSAPFFTFYTEFGITNGNIREWTSAVSMGKSVYNNAI